MKIGVAGAVLVAVGMMLWSLAAGLIVAGLELLGAAYMVAYFEAHEVRR